MKKLIVVAAVLLMFTATVSAQDFSFGVKGGMNIAKTSNFDNTFNTTLHYADFPYVTLDSAKMMPGFYVGAFVEGKFNDFIGISPEFVYSMQGTKYEGSVSVGEIGERFDSKMTLNYLNIPIMAKFYVTKGLSIDVGPQIGILASAKFKVDGGDDSSDMKEMMKTFDMALGFGATYNINKFFIQGRYNLGLTDIVDWGENGMPSGLGFKASKNNVLQVGVGVRF